MKRDMELVRKILLAVEESDDARRRGMRPKIDGHEDDVIQAHVGLLWRRGLLDALDGSSRDGESYIITGLTWEGYDFIEAARVLDLGTGHIIFREILPNMMSYITINFILAVTAAMTFQAVLVFLGVVPLSGTNWGVMIQLAFTRGAIFSKDSFWYIMAPIIVISLLQLSMVTMTRSLEDIFNPRLRAGN